ncbi:helix-turn-helix domain-containing protein [Glutamicibacter arilaitensis]|uniref:helix-turn-helix domain-containing protein n=1 Tax=Glutamicibacter arilaitensis TaxID=256701 RepID=UPI0038516218
MTLESELLKALAGGASAHELRALSTRETTADSLAAPMALGQALQIRQHLDDLAERERSLVQLSDSVRELAGLDAMDSVLLSIVSRSRRLLMADVAYFLAFDQDTAVASMMVSEGILSDAFANLQVPPKEGISGLIAASRKPSWTADYMADDRYRHNAVIDSATREEGLRAILGVPVLRAGRVVGLLLAADRRAHDFLPQDVELLFSLAQHAGILIENATLHQAGLQTVERLEEAVQSLRASEAATATIMDFQDRLFALLMTKGSLNDLAQLVRETLGGTVIVGDEEGRLMARAGAAQTPVEEGFGWTIERIGIDTAPMGFVAHLGEPMQVPVGAADQRQILARAATVAALLVSKLQADLSTVRERSVELIGELLREPASDRVPMLQSGLPVDIHSLGTVLIAQAPAKSQLMRSAQQRADREGGLAAPFRDAVLLWLPSQKVREAARNAAEALADLTGAPVTVGGASLLDGPGSLATAANEAVHTLRALLALGHEGTGAHSSDVAPFPAIMANNTPDELRTFVRETLGTLLDYDTRHGTDLAATLDQVYASGSNATVAADALFVHTNTVHQRLARIDQVTGENWRDGNVAMRRQLALKIRALMDHPMGRDPATHSTSVSTSTAKGKAS